MEIVTYVLEGALEHRDSTGSHGIIRPGDAQRMSAGSGFRHSEQNASDREPVHFLQIWILPSERGIPPGYEQKTFPPERRKGLQTIASPDGREGSVTLRQDAVIRAAELDAGEEVTLELAPARGTWVQVAHGTVTLGHGFGPGKGGAAGSGAGDSKIGMECAGERTELEAGDGAALTGEIRLSLGAGSRCEVLLFDLG